MWSCNKTNMLLSDIKCFFPFWNSALSAHLLIPGLKDNLVSSVCCANFNSTAICHLLNITCNYSMQPSRQRIAEGAQPLHGKILAVVSGSVQQLLGQLLPLCSHLKSQDCFSKAHLTQQELNYHLCLLPVWEKTPQKLRGVRVDDGRLASFSVVWQDSC